MFKTLRVEIQAGRAVILKRQVRTRWHKGSFMVQVLTKDLNNRWVESEAYRYITKQKHAEIFFNFEWTKVA